MGWEEEMLKNGEGKAMASVDPGDLARVSRVSDRLDWY
jgi:hypothetical protein